jgi:hypothetical protein
MRCASYRSVFCFRTCLVRISAASPIHSSKCRSFSNGSNQDPCPLASMPTRTAQASDRISPPRPRAALSAPGTRQCLYQLLLSAETGAWKIYSCNDTVRILSPSPWLVTPPKLTPQIKNKTQNQSSGVLNAATIHFVYPPPAMAVSRAVKHHMNPLSSALQKLPVCNGI